jgi:regulatory protein YycI of two-component signal transduction system YycFG
MFKFLTKKIQSLSETQRNILTVILILLNVFIVTLWVNFWVLLRSISKIEVKPIVEEEVPQEVIEKLSAPSSEKSKEVPKEVLEKLSAPKK